MLEQFIAAFVLIFLSELGDKSQIAMILLASKYHKNQRMIFLGAISAFALLFLIAVIFGNFVLSIVPAYLLKILSSIAFILIGFYILIERQEKKIKVKKGHPFIVSFFLISLSEIGDKTQISAILLTARLEDPLSIFLGAIAAETLLVIIALIFGKKLAEKISIKTLKKVSAALFIAIGIVSIFM